MFWRKNKREDVEEDIEEKPEIINPYPINKTINGNDILNGVCPWAIITTLLHYHRNSVVYKIKVFSFDKNDWEKLSDASEKILGITRDEYFRIIEEKFRAKVFDKGCTWIEEGFENLEDAIKAVEEFKSYYDTFYIPRAIAKRLGCYIEGGYPPYFTEKYKGNIY